MRNAHHAAHAHAACTGHADASARASRAGERLVGSHRPHHHRSAPTSSARVCTARRAARWQDAHSQLRARRRGHVAVVGNRRDGRRSRARASGAARGGARLWRCWSHHRAATPAARVRGEHLRGDSAAGHNVQHVTGGFYADVRLVRQRAAHARMGRAVSPGGAHCLPPAATAGRPEIRRQLDSPVRAD
jgi:hypothetical protein